VRAMQLREAAALDEQLAELGAEHHELDNKLQTLEERDVRHSYQMMQSQRQDHERRNNKLGYLQQKLAGWAAEFERVTAVTNVKFGDGKTDAVNKVLEIFTANELRNKSIFKYVTEDVTKQIEALETALEAERALEAKLDAEQAAIDDADRAAAVSAALAMDGQAAFEKHLEHMSRAVESILPTVEAVGSAVHLELPQHMAEKLPLAPPSVPEFLAILEDQLDQIVNTARQIVTERAPPPPEMDENGRPKTPPPEPTPSDSLVVLRGLVHPKTLASGKNNVLLHKDSSERLLPM